MRVGEPVLKPEYLFQPAQIFRRLARRGTMPAEVRVPTPWGLPMRVNPSETVGHALWHLGVYDLIASEVAWRLLQPGETAVDVGANVGVMSGLMARRSGAGGRVTGFEPHPKVFAALQSNVESWKATGLPLAEIRIERLALSATAGEATLSEPESFSNNQGLASLESPENSGARVNQFRVRTVTLDSLFPGTIQLLKVDVEGHEAQVFAGAEASLRAGRIRDILFEDHLRYPSASATLLKAAGYTLFFLNRTLWGPVLAPPEAGGTLPPWLPPNWLATRDPERALAACRPRGWRVLAART